MAAKPEEEPVNILDITVACWHITPDFWMSLQSSYDVKIARAASGKEIEKNVKPKELLAA